MINMRKIPQINPDSGISFDYLNEYFGRMTTYDMERIDFFNELCNNHPIKKYEERYPKDKYEYNTYPGLKEKIESLDELAELFNKEFDGNKPFNEELLKNMINNVYNIVHGNKFYIL